MFNTMGCLNSRVSCCVSALPFVLGLRPCVRGKALTQRDALELGVRLYNLTVSYTDIHLCQASIVYRMLPKHPTLTLSKMQISKHQSYIHSCIQHNSYSHQSKTTSSMIPIHFRAHPTSNTNRRCIYIYWNSCQTGNCKKLGNRIICKAN